MGGIALQGFKRLNREEIMAAYASLTPSPLVVEVAERIASTNTELVRRASQCSEGEVALGGSDLNAAVPIVLAARHQTHGRGRTGRSWVSQSDEALTFSLYLEADVPVERSTWLPLIVGNAIAEVLTRDSGVPALVKWPNDILLRTDLPEVSNWLGLRKLGGILVERVGKRGFVIGIGINVGQSSDSLPVVTAASLRSAGYLDINVNELVAAIVFEVIAQVSDWEKQNGDPDLSGVRALAEEFSVTIGAHVAVELPGKGILTGDAIGFGDSGELLIRKENGECFALSAGDVGHLRLR